MNGTDGIQASPFLALAMCCVMHTIHTCQLYTHDNASCDRCLVSQNLFVTYCISRLLGHVGRHRVSRQSVHKLQALVHCFMHVLKQVPALVLQVFIQEHKACEVSLTTHMLTTILTGIPYLLLLPCLVAIVLIPLSNLNSSGGVNCRQLSMWCSPRHMISSN